MPLFTLQAHVRGISYEFFFVKVKHFMFDKGRGERTRAEGSDKGRSKRALPREFSIYTIMCVCVCVCPCSVWTAIISTLCVSPVAPFTLDVYWSQLSRSLTAFISSIKVSNWMCKAHFWEDWIFYLDVRACPHVSLLWYLLNAASRYPN